MNKLAHIAILAGGNSRRMGQNKAQLLFEGETLLSRLVQDACQLGLATFVCADDYTYSEIATQNITLSPDLLLNKSGALSAIQPVLEQSYLANRQWLWVYSCDALLLPSEIIDLFQQAIDEIDANQDTQTKTILLKNHKLLPLVGLYHTSLVKDLKDYLLAGNRRVMPFCDQFKMKEIELPDSVSLCCNFNTPEQFENAKQQYTQYRKNIG
ncbi:molybdenum cofactor guanylyltransferase [Phocoenobacter skyensis]|uniref:Molybdenum cofactor guanylyltransferase n=1 Tax=Phocoenobacter skyensis TaxID=97481 RepID=A0A1H7YZN4_9PAST|nr:molybdenum cofactor guanylyltransferase [Pasteurella skyensis]MDP8080133.1 molybdenum cofactor guanylyltransferase [Pasteurella skyensis]MDP8086099.1 molybdenum cofactor guanylyltransferase [Pasteurella skyensis]MDP8185817.1 molybdenum cofactor guanylyltransferase [Pasteurella skyensis]QLB22704.1 hypothetical protein A6B44_05560 [Pasteurella skyensis]SEM50788.1 molybdopterin-guanine dinucleotide biosynthesis protein A [Pasteurella skyensis]